MIVHFRGPWNKGNVSVTKQKGESQNRRYKKTKHAKFTGK